MVYTCPGGSRSLSVSLEVYTCQGDNRSLSVGLRVYTCSGESMSPVWVSQCIPAQETVWVLVLVYWCIPAQEPIGVSVCVSQCVPAQETVWVLCVSHSVYLLWRWGFYAKPSRHTKKKDPTPISITKCPQWIQHFSNNNTQKLCPAGSTTVKKSRSHKTVWPAKLRCGWNAHQRTNTV